VFLWVHPHRLFPPTSSAPRNGIATPIDHIQLQLQKSATLDLPDQEKYLLVCLHVRSNGNQPGIFDLELAGHSERRMNLGNIEGRTYQGITTNDYPSTLPQFSLIDKKNMVLQILVLKASTSEPNYLGRNYYVGLTGKSNE